MNLRRIGTAFVFCAWVPLGWTVGPPSDGTPDMVHMSWEDDPSTTIAIQWRTKGRSADIQALCTAQGAPGPLVAKADSRPVPGGADRFGFLHTARLKKLRPDTRYHCVLSGDAPGKIANASFHTAPRKWPANGISFAAYADQGSFATSKKVNRSIARDKDIRFVLVMGDLSYADGAVDGPALWLTHGVNDYASAKPIMPSWGNHEYRPVADGAVLTPRVQAPYFPLPVPSDPTLVSDKGKVLDLKDSSCVRFPDGQTFRRYYSWTYGGVHFLSLDDPSENNVFFESLGGWDAMRTWVSKDLAKAKADPAVRWIVVLGHRAPFSTALHYYHTGGELEERCCQSRTQDWDWDRYGVDLFLSGHDHHYLATDPVPCSYRDVSDSCGKNDLSQIQKARGLDRVYENPKGAVYVVAGIGGGPFYVQQVPRPWVAARSAAHHGYVKITASEHELRVTALKSKGDPNDPIDRFVIKK